MVDAGGVAVELAQRGHPWGWEWASSARGPDTSRIHGRGSQDHRSLEGRQSTPGRGGRSSPQLARGTSDEDVFTARVQHPVVALPRVVVVPRHLHEALVQREVVSDRVLPALFVLTVVREVPHDVLVDAVESQPLLGTLSDGHHDQRVVAVRRLLVLLLLLGFVFFVDRSVGAVEWRWGVGARHVQVRLQVADIASAGAGRQARALRTGRLGRGLGQDGADAERGLERSSRHRYAEWQLFNFHHGSFGNGWMNNTEAKRARKVSSYLWCNLHYTRGTNKQHSVGLPKNTNTGPNQQTRSNLFYNAQIKRKHNITYITWRTNRRENVVRLYQRLRRY